MANSWHFQINSHLHHCWCCRHCFTSLNSNTKLYSKLDQGCSYSVGHSGSDRWGSSRWNTGTKNSHQMGRRSINRFTKQVIVKCDWNSTQFCITPVRFNYSAYNREQIKFHLQDIYDNAFLNVQLLGKEIFETFSKSLPSSNNLETLAEQLANQLSGLTHSIGSGAITLIVVLVIIFVVYRCLSTKIVQTKQTQLVRAFFTKVIKKGELSGNV